MVWLVKDGRLQKQAVTKSMETREGWLIDAGLADGYEIVRDANTKGLQEGKKAAAA
jgi:hypothetical protein